MLGDTKLASEIATMYDHSAHRISEILRGKAHIKPMSFNPIKGRFYPRIRVADCVYRLGAFPSVEQAGAAYEVARMGVRRGEPVLLPHREKPNADDIRRFYPAPAVLKFGDREGELVVSIDADQE